MDISCAFATSSDTPAHVELAESLGYDSTFVTHIAGRDSLTVPAAGQDERRQLGAHQHGHGTVDIAIDKRTTPLVAGSYEDTLQIDVAASN